MGRLVPVAATIGLLLGGAVAPSVASAQAGAVESGYNPPPIVWGPCESPGLRAAKAECGPLVVPLDYGRPGGAKIKVAVSRVKHTVPAAQYQGIMLVNPGGPGGSGLDFALIGGLVPDGVGKAYDWIGFDPRGVGASEPALSCDGGYFAYDRPPYVPRSRAIENTWRARARGYAADCAAAGGPLLAHLKTVDNIADMDSVRRALGQKKINFYGFSYGTYLGQVYSTLHPDKVRRMVLDANVDPRRVWYQANLDQDTAFNRNIKIFFGWVAKHDDVYRLGNTGRKVEALYYAQQRKLDRSPAGGVIGPDEWADLFLPAGYATFLFPRIAEAFAGWVHDGDFATLKELYDGGSPQGEGADNGYAMYVATVCTDASWPKDWNVWRRDNWRIYAKAPFVTWGNAWFNAPCAYWSARAGQPVRVNGSKAPPILLISETLDAATPYEGTLEVRSRFPKASLIEGVGGTTHAGSLNGIACTDNKVAAYLATGALPQRVGGRRSDAKCEPNPQPEPLAPQAVTAKRGAAGSAPTDAVRAELRRAVSTR